MSGLHSYSADCPICNNDPGIRVLAAHEWHEDAPDSYPNPNPDGVTETIHNYWDKSVTHSHTKNPPNDGHTWWHGTDFHSSRENPDPLKTTDETGERGTHWNSHLGTHFTSLHPVARDFATDGFGYRQEQDEDEHVTREPYARIAHAHIHMKNPAIYHTEDDLDNHFKAFLQEHRGLSPQQTNSRIYGYPDARGLQHIEAFRSHLREKGRDGIIYGNTEEGPPEHRCAIAFRDTPVTVHHWEWLRPEHKTASRTQNEEKHNFAQFGCYHTACGRVLKNRREATQHVAYEDVPTTKIAPVRHVIEGARDFALRKGLQDPHRDIDYHRVMTHRDLITDLGHAYDRLPQRDPKAIPHFEAMRDEVAQQYHHLTNRMGIHVQVEDHDPYKDVHELADDVRNNHRIRVLGTHATGGHPFFSNEENDRFRAVHDVFGHLATGRGFDRHGEEAAYQAHSRMFSHFARPAMASETRGQNGSLITNGSFGPQRIALLPRRLWTPELAHLGGLVDEYRWARDEQNRRAEQFSGGNKTEHDNYFGFDGEGDAQEKRLTYKNWLTQHKGPEEVRRTPHEEAYWDGHELGSRHGENPQNADFDEMEYRTMHHSHPDHFYQGYLDGFKGMSHTWDRIAVMVSDSPIKVVAHVSGNQIDILHCPFCGSGAVIGRSDGTVECGYCTAVFTVQTQPQYNGFPQSVDGQPYQWPGMPDSVGEPVDPNDLSAGTTGGDVTAEPDIPPGTNLNPNTNGESGGSSDPAEGGPDMDEDGDEDDDKPAFLKGKGDSDSKSDDKKDDKKKGKNPFAKKKSYKTAFGGVVDEDNYIAHLAILFADDKTRMAQLVKSARKR